MFRSLASAVLGQPKNFHQRMLDYGFTFSSEPAGEPIYVNPRTEVTLNIVVTVEAKK